MASTALAEPLPRVDFEPAPAEATAALPAVSNEAEARRGPMHPVRSALVMLATLSLTFVGYLTVGSTLEHNAAQTNRYAHLRGQLALGTAPVGPTDANGHLLAMGTPIAVLRIPSLGLREVVGEGTTGSVLASGPGHLRSTVFPGGAGTSVVLGRAHAYGGPFGSIGGLKHGTNITVTSANGTATLHVVDVRRAGQPIPTLNSGSARVTLVTATGSPYSPSGTVSVDADTTKPLPSTPPVLSNVPAAERPMGTSTSGMWMVFLWTEALLLLSFAAVWLWYRRSPAHALILCSAPVLLAAAEACRSIAPLLPNLM
ncbi:MAG TPA: sortase [Acidimicrobiia bacterium]